MMRNALSERWQNGIVLACLLFFLLFLGGLAVDKKTALEIESQIEKHRQETIKIRRYFHMNPELANREYETANLISSKLISLGLETKTQIAKTGVVGLLRGTQPGPTIAIRAQMDALPIQELVEIPYKSLNPGIMHACGHDIHMAIVLGTALVLSELKDAVKGNIKFIFQPAEEGPPEEEERGSSLMVKEGVLENPVVGAIFSFHAWPEDVGQVYFKPGILLANSDSFRIVVKGRNAQGTRPQEGIDSIALASQIVLSFQSGINRDVHPSDPVSVTIGKIEGGWRDNMIADETVLEGTVKTLSDKARKKIPQLMENLIWGITHSFGAAFTMTYHENTPAVYNHPELAKIVLPTLVNLLGKERVHDISPQLVSDDFSFFSQKIPGFFFLLGVKNPRQPGPAPLHSPHFNPDERSIALGIRIVCHLLLDCLEQQSLSSK